jgi:hypothetical protein
MPPKDISDAVRVGIQASNELGSFMKLSVLPELRKQYPTLLSFTHAKVEIVCAIHEILVSRLPASDQELVAGHTFVHYQHYHGSSDSTANRKYIRGKMIDTRVKKRGTQILRKLVLLYKQLESSDSAAAVPDSAAAAASASA